MNKLEGIKACKKCNLYKNQAPLLDSITDNLDVMWVGLSAKKVNSVCTSRPLEKNTLTGSLISKIEHGLPGVNFYSSNLVKCLPLDVKSKIRYPNQKEIRLCFNHLKLEIEVLSPKIVVLLGKIVTNNVVDILNLKEDLILDPGFEYRSIESDGGFKFLPVHHPSHIGVYKKNEINTYTKSIQGVITNLLK